jgi:glycosyltransferase involved in cell wall biosynthesis
MARRIRIGYITTGDPADRTSWSGTFHYLLKALKEKADVEVFWPLRPAILPWLRALNFVGLRTLRKRYNYRDSPVLSKAYARLIQRRLKQAHFDLLIAPAGLATIAHLRTDIPIVHINDRCLAGALDYHPVLSDLFMFSRRDGVGLERQALKNSEFTIYGSQWAADEARKHYPEFARKIFSIPFGANLEVLPARPADRESPAIPLKLLFLGSKWNEKGGPIALEVFQILKKKGVPVKLVICGCHPDPPLNDPDIIVEGFLDKNDPQQQKKLLDHLTTSDVLIMPTRFEAYGIVLCEAAWYGIPSLATRTGGVPTIIDDGVTGHLFSLEDRGEAYADVIMAWLNDPSKWRSMRMAARRKAEEKLNWPAFVDALLSQVGTISSINRER